MGSKVWMLALLAWPAGAQGLSIPCEPSRETIRLLEAVPPLRDLSTPYEERVGTLRTLAKARPEDFFVQRAYQDSFRRERYLADEYDRALAMYRLRPEDPMSRYWEARLLLFADTKAEKTLTEFAAAHPDFAWVREDLMELGQLPGRRANEEMGKQMGQFFQACPAAFGMPVREALERRNTPLELVSWIGLWETEAQEADAGFAARVRADLKRIEAWPFRADPDLHFVYEAAARVLQDPGVMAQLRARVEREKPGSLLALQMAENDWDQANPQPDRNASAEAHRAYNQMEAQGQRERLGRWPDAWFTLLRVLMGMDSDAHRTGSLALSARDLEIIDAAQRVRAKSPDGGEMWPPLETTVARLYVAGKVRLERVPALLDAGLRKVDLMQRYQVSMELMPAELRSRANDWGKITGARTEEIRVDYLLAMKRPADARPLIERAVAKLGAPGSAQNPMNDTPARRVWMRRLAEADVLEGRTEDALRDYQASLIGWSKSLLKMPGVEGDVAEAKSYYLAHGGTEEQWPVWATTATARTIYSAPVAELEFPSRLPEFAAKDLSGRDWSLASLKGKATLLVYWATWCEPCRGEHPGIQELYEKTKERQDIQVLTISVDDDAAAAQKYMTENHYTFPVLWAPQLADKLFPWEGLPSSFLVNPEGARTGMYPVGADSAGVARLIEKLGRIAKKGK